MIKKICTHSQMFGVSGIFQVKEAASNLFFTMRAYYHNDIKYDTKSPVPHHIKAHIFLIPFLYIDWTAKILARKKLVQTIMVICTHFSNQKFC